VVLSELHDLSGLFGGRVFRNRETYATTLKKMRAEGWNEIKAGALVVFIDPDTNKKHVVSGHHRRLFRQELAAEQGDSPDKVLLRALLVTEADVPKGTSPVNYVRALLDEVVRPPEERDRLHMTLGTTPFQSALTAVGRGDLPSRTGGHYLNSANLIRAYIGFTRACKAHAEGKSPTDSLDGLKRIKNPSHEPEFLDAGTDAVILAGEIAIRKMLGSNGRSESRFFFQPAALAFVPLLRADPNNVDSNYLRDLYTRRLGQQNRPFKYYGTGVTNPQEVLGRLLDHVNYKIQSRNMLTIFGRGTLGSSEWKDKKRQ
jgi:hypothetical protein